MLTKTLSVAFILAFAGALSLGCSDDGDSSNSPSSTGGSGTGGATSGTGGAGNGTGGATSGTGGNSATTGCTGTAFSCDLLAGSFCTADSGCYASGECEGSAWGCILMNTAEECIFQGCDWDSSDSSCSGTPDLCSSHPGESTCESELGCRWSDTCEGSALPCDVFDESECGNHLGCTWL